MTATTSYMKAATTLPWRITPPPSGKQSWLHEKAYHYNGSGYYLWLNSNLTGVIALPAPAGKRLPMPTTWLR